MRRAAAFAVAAIDPVDGSNRIWKQAKGKTQVAAQEALALVLRGQGPFAEADRDVDRMNQSTGEFRQAPSWSTG